MTKSGVNSITVGFTGHRPNRLHIGETRVAVRVREVLTALRDGALASAAIEPLVAISPLAEGSDRLFAQAALDLGYELRAMLPFKSADYETTFGDATTTSIYRTLLAQAARVQELPGSLNDTTAAYESMGHAMVEASDILVTVWDGKPAAGRGGTPEIIEYAIACGRPVIWIDAALDREVMRLRVVVPPIEAVPITSADIATLAKGILGL